VCHITVTILLMVNCEMLIVEVCGKGSQLVSKLSSSFIPARQMLS